MSSSQIPRAAADQNAALRAKYDRTAFFYDLLDFPWEMIYRNWRPKLIGDVRGKVLEAGVGTGRNLPHYHPSVELVGIDLNDRMLGKAARRAKTSSCKIELTQDDATVMRSLEDNQFDWLVSTFMCCVMPNELQTAAIEQFGRVLKPGGRFRILEIVYSKHRKIRHRQDLFAPFVEKVYGARFDRHTLRYLEQSAKLQVTGTSYLKDDVYLLIEGIRHQ